MMKALLIQLPSIFSITLSLFATLSESYTCTNYHSTHFQRYLNHNPKRYQDVIKSKLNQHNFGNKESIKLFKTPKCLFATPLKETLAEVSKESTLNNETDVLSSTQSISSKPIKQGPTKAEYQQGLIIIGIITLLFSSNSPVIHAAFVKSSIPPPVLLLNAATSTIALAGIFVGGPLLDATVPLPCTLTEDPQLTCKDTPDSTSLQAGIELGLWKMLGTTANLYGLSLTSADHGAFLIQLTTLIVPVAQGIIGVPIPKRIWAAVALALTGVFLFTTDSLGSAGTAIGSNDVIKGDALCILAAMFYALYDLRLFHWGNKVQPLELIKNKILVQASLSIALLTACAWQETSSYFSAVTSDTLATTSDLWLVGSAALWSGIVINAVAPFLQVGGQQAVGATRAQVIYASQPLWAALISLCLLGETLDQRGFIGGTLFLSAMFIASKTELPDPNCEETICEV